MADVSEVGRATDPQRGRQVQPARVVPPRDQTAPPDPPVSEVAQAIATDLAAMDPLRRETFGHGSFGVACIFCATTDYGGQPLVHDEGCVWLRAKALCSDDCSALDQADRA